MDNQYFEDEGHEFGPDDMKLPNDIVGPFAITPEEMHQLNDLAHLAHLEPHDHSGVSFGSSCTDCSGSCYAVCASSCASQCSASYSK